MKSFPGKEDFRGFPIFDFFSDRKLGMKFNLTVFEIDLLCALSGCTRGINLYKNCEFEKLAHTGCTGFKIYAPGSQNVHTCCKVHH